MEYRTHRSRFFFNYFVLVSFFLSRTPYFALALSSVRVLPLPPLACSSRPIPSVAAVRADKWKLALLRPPSDAVLNIQRPPAVS